MNNITNNDEVKEIVTEIVVGVISVIASAIIKK